MIQFSQISLLIRNTFQKEFRNKTIVFLMMFTFLVIGASFLIIHGLLQNEQYANMAEMIGYGLPHFFIGLLGTWTLFITLLLGSQLVRSDFQENVLGQLLALPLRRSEYLAGRLTGGWLIIMAFYFFTALFIFLLFSSVSQEFVPLISFLTSVLVMAMMVFATLIVSVTVSFYFPGIFSFIGSFFLMLIIFASNNYFAHKSFIDVFKEANILGLFLSIFYYLFPRLGDLGRLNSAILSNKELGEGILALGVHAVGAFALIFIFISFIFKRKDL